MVHFTLCTQMQEGIAAGQIIRTRHPPGIAPFLNKRHLESSVAMCMCESSSEAGDVVQFTEAYGPVFQCRGAIQYCGQSKGLLSQYRFSTGNMGLRSGRRA
jgi:hypothetical protein